MNAPDDDRDAKLLDDLLEGRPAANDDEAAQRAPYEQVMRLLREAPQPEVGWAARVDARVVRELRAQRRRRVAAAVAVCAAALTAVVLVTRRKPHESAPARVAIQIERPDGAVRRGATAVGDTLRLSVPATAPAVTLRVYRQARPVLVCPGAATCTQAGGELTATLLLTAAGTYRIVTATAVSPLPPLGADGEASLDADVLALRNAGAHLEFPDPVVVNP